MSPRILLLAICVICSTNAQARGKYTADPSAVTAIVNTTLIDGNGGPAEPGMTIVIVGSRIEVVAPAHLVAIPREAEIIDGSSRWVVPGLFNTNVHLSGPVFDLAADKSDLPLWRQIVLRKAHEHLRLGQTTVLDTYGVIEPLIAARQAIAQGKVMGPRLLVSGNVVGWSGYPSITQGSYGPMSKSQRKSLEESSQVNSVNRLVSSGSGDELTVLSAGELGERVQAYVDRGLDFIKYGGTTHTNLSPMLPIFTLEQQKSLVRAVHDRGKFVSTHCTSPEGMRSCALAGVDMIQHAANSRQVIPDDVIALIVERDVVCSMLYGGPKDGTDDGTSDYGRAVMTNIRKLLAAGCTLTIETDGDIDLVEVMERLTGLGATPQQLIVAATRNAARVTRLLQETGTVERGKAADLLILDADPLQNIGNLKRLFRVIKGGVAVTESMLIPVPEKRMAGGSGGD
jgi:imidazolonepropionase-like amidohydrolase